MNTLKLLDEWKDLVYLQYTKLLRHFEYKCPVALLSYRVKSLDFCVLVVGALEQQGLVGCCFFRVDDVLRSWYEMQ